ncbi:CRISPR system precrRNA processing endoribonuclease RAMP protein Cas6 [Actinomyces oricola]
MPSTVFVQFDAPTAPAATPRRLHAAWGRVFDLPEGVSPERAARLPALAARPAHDRAGSKPYCLGAMTAGPRLFGIELRFLDDRLLDTLDGWLAWGGVLRLGDSGANNVTLAATGAQVVDQLSWEKLRELNNATTWEIHLLSPTVFTSRGRHVSGISPASLATSLCGRWRNWSPATAPRLPDREAFSRVLATQDFTHPVTTSLGMPRTDRRGRLATRRIEAYEGRLRITGLTGAESTRVFSQLMALARFTNVGSHTSYGMGVLDVETVG